MKVSTLGLTLGAMSMAGFLTIAGCSSHEEKVSSVPPPEVVVQPAPVIVAPAPRVMTEKTTTERSVNDTADNSADATGNNTSQQRSSSYRSETTTVTPAAPQPPVSETTTTTVQKKSYEANY
jgi:hypothetical protein